MATWDELYERGLRPAEPLPWLVKAATSLKASGAERILNLGCGGGRHLVHLGRLGFSLWGIDSAPHGLAHSRAWLDGEELTAQLALADMRALPFAAASFDAVISIHVLYHATRSGVQAAVQEARRVLREGGTFVCTLLSSRAWKFGEGQQLEADTFVQARGPEAGVPHHYCDESSAAALLQGFNVLDLHLDEFLDDGGERQSHWEVLARRR